MLQVVRVAWVMLTAVVVSGCSHIDIKGLFFPTSDGVQSRFEQSVEMNDELKAALLESDESYVFYVATDAHVDKTHDNLTVFNDALRSDTETAFAVMLGDCCDVRDNLPRYLNALSYDPERHACDPRIFHVLGNHDIFFNGWEEFKKLVGASVYWFEVAFDGGKDLYITLDTATGTLGHKQTEWLKTFLANNRSLYRHCVILTHTNFFYTDNSQAGSGNMPMEECLSLIDLFSRHIVSLVLQGHDHYREELLYNGVNYTVVGAILDEISAPEYLRVTVTSQGLHLDWHNI